MTNTQPVTCPLCRRSLDGKVTRHYLLPPEIWEEERPQDPRQRVPRREPAQNLSA
jgi:hypothetical protein